MDSFLLYVLLGFGAGAAYALLANGIVAIYKGSGILNFAQGAVAMFATYCYAALINGGMDKYVALVVTVVGAVIGGMLLSAAIIRPLAHAPVLAKVIATLGLLTALEGLATIIWGTNTQFVPSLFPTHGIAVLGGHVGEDRLFMLGIAILSAILLWAGFRFTRLGLATQAASQNERGAALLGYSPAAISAVNWGLGCGLAAIAGALIAPLTGLDTSTLPLVVLPALAAALVGGFSSFGITTFTAIAIGSIESAVFDLWAQQGVQTAAPFVIVIVAMVIAGRGIPQRGSLSLTRPPRASSGRVPWVFAGIGLAAVIVMLVEFNATYQGALDTSLTMAVLALSLVVVTGYVGQVTLMQMTFAGIGGYLTAKFAFNLGIPFPFSIIVAALVTAPIGVVLGLPSLRVRGMALAVVTLGAAVTVDAVFFQNNTWAGGLDGEQVPSPSIWGFSLDPFLHPTRYGVLCLIVLILAATMVSNLRRSGTGKRMLAVRTNERAAAVAGVNVARVKLEAFSISSVIAALGGGLLAYSNPYIEFGSGQFAAQSSITLITIAYIGSIASVSGALIAGFIASGGVIYELLSGISGFDNWYILISGVALLWTVIAQPDGAAVFNQRMYHTLIDRVRQRRGEPGPPVEPSPGPSLAEPSPRSPTNV